MLYFFLEVGFLFYFLNPQRGLSHLSCICYLWCYTQICSMWDRDRCAEVFRGSWIKNCGSTKEVAVYFLRHCRVKTNERSLITEAQGGSNIWLMH